MHDRYRSVGFTLLLAGLLILVGWVQRRALLSFFGPDDLVHIEQATGLRPTPGSPLRVLSQSVYFKALLSVVGPYPLAFHLVSMLLHLLVLVLLARCLRRLGLSRWASLLAVGLFGAHPLIYPTLVFAVNVNEILAIMGFLLALELAACRSSFVVLLAPGALSAAFFCKESVVLLPLLTPWLLNGEARARPAWLPTAVMIGSAIVLGAGFFALRDRGLGPGGAAYEAALGSHMIFNMTTYLQWACSLGTPIPDAVATYDPGSWPVGATVLAAAGLACWRAPSIRRFIGVGLGWFLLGGLPVFVLLRHTYANYLYVSGIGLAIGVAVTAEAVVLWFVQRLDRAPLRRPGALRRTTRSLHPIAGVEGGVVAFTVLFLLASFALQADRLLERRIQARMPGLDMPADPLTRKATISERAIVSLLQQPPGLSRCLALYAAPGARVIVGARSGNRYDPNSKARGYDLQREALDGGTAIRIFLPSIQEVHFVSVWGSALTACALYSRTREGYLVAHGSGAGAGVGLARLLLTQGESESALAVAESLLAIAPGDSNALAVVGQVGHSPKEHPPADVGERDRNR